jgi:hypothetical protein
MNTPSRPPPTRVSVSVDGVGASSITVPVRGFDADTVDVHATVREVPPVRRLWGVNPLGEVGAEQAPNSDGDETLRPTGSPGLLGSKLKG